VQDDDNFVYSAAIDMEEQSVQSGTVITIDWSGLSTNLAHSTKVKPCQSDTL